MFDPSKPCATRSGRRVEIIAVLPPDKTPNDGQNIIALVYGQRGGEGVSIETFYPDGKFLAARRRTVWDLVNVPARTSNIAYLPPRVLVDNTTGNP